MRNFFEKKNSRENQKENFTFDILFFFLSLFLSFFTNRAVYEIMWKNMEKSDGPQMRI